MPNGEKNVLFNIYRNGKLCASAVKGSSWLDTQSDTSKVTHYNIESYYPESGNCSHLSPTRTYYPEDSFIELPASDMNNTGGNLVNNDHFENWGKPEHELSIDSFTVEQNGKFVFRAIYSNGAGPINTGITCSVKHIAITDQ